MDAITRTAWPPWSQCHLLTKMACPYIQVCSQPTSAHKILVCSISRTQHSPGTYSNSHEVWDLRLSSAENCTPSQCTSLHESGRATQFLLCLYLETPQTTLGRTLISPMSFIQLLPSNKEQNWQQVLLGQESHTERKGT